MAASAAGTISHLSTSRAWTTAEFKGVAERAGKAASGLQASIDCRYSSLTYQRRQLGKIRRNPLRLALEISGLAEAIFSIAASGFAIAADKAVTTGRASMRLDRILFRSERGAGRASEKFFG
jgi:hypothetical protein